MNTTKKKRLKKFLYLFLLQSLIPAYYLFAYHNEKHPEEYLIKVWTVEDGLPQNTIQALLQTDDGFIWIGTPTGLVRFDGLRFKIYTHWNLSILESDNITCLYEDQNNVLWVGTEGGGLYARQAEQWRHYSSAEGLSSEYVRAIISDQQGDLWVGTDYGLNRINKDGIQIYTEKDGLYDNIITTLAVDSWNNLWIGTFRGGLAKYNQEITTVYAYQEGLKNLSVRSLLADEMGIVWIGTGEGMFYLERDEGIVNSVLGTSYTPITTLMEKSPDKLWLGTMVGGLKQMSLHDMSRGTVTDLLPDDYIRCLLTDNAGNTWIGTDTGGLVQLKVKRIFNITEEDGLPDKVISSIFQDRSGTIWIGTRDKGLAKFRNKKIYGIFDKNYGLSSNKIRVIFEDKQGHLWIGTEDQGINILKGNMLIKKITTDDGLSSNHITAILQDQIGTIWIGTTNGLDRYLRGRISSLEETRNAVNLAIHVLLESRQNFLYAGTNKGIYSLSENGFLPLDQSSSFDYNVISLFEDQFGVLWIGTNGDGLFRWTDGQFEKITKEDGLKDNFILSIHQDEKSNLWMSSHSGVFWVKRRELTNFFDKKTSTIHSTWYSEAEGMSSRQCTGEGQLSVLKSQYGQWLYPTVNGVSIIDPQKIEDYCTIPIVSLENVLSLDDPVTVRDEIIPVLSSERVTFIFTATEFAAPEKIQFKYKLEGFDDKFRFLNPSQERKVDYHNLSSGVHTIHVWGVNNEGGLSEQAAIFSFRIKSPFYLNPIYLILFITLSLFFSSTLIYYNHKRKIQKRLSKYKTSSLDPSKIAEIADRLDELMDNEQLFLNPDLTLKELSLKLKMHSNYISRIINEYFGMSYNDFINKYRVEEVKKRFEDPDYSNKTVLEIMYETGFYSKSVFNTAFKKFCNMTPSTYRKQIN